MALTTADGKECEGLEQGPFEPIAVIGLAAIMPDAENSSQFWQNIIDGSVSNKFRKEDGQVLQIISGDKVAPGL